MCPLFKISSWVHWRFNPSIHLNICNQCMDVLLGSISLSLTMVNNLVIFHNEDKPLLEGGRMGRNEGGRVEVREGGWDEVREEG